MLKKLLIALCATFLIVGLIVGCGGSSSGGTAPPPPPPPTDGNDDDDDDDDDDDEDCDIIEGQTFTIDVSSQEGVDAWVQNEETDNMVAEFDAEAGTMALVPLEWVEGETRQVVFSTEGTDLEGVDLSNATMRVEYTISENYLYQDGAGDATQSPQSGFVVQLMAFSGEDEDGGLNLVGDTWTGSMWHPADHAPEAAVFDDEHDTGEVTHFAFQFSDPPNDTTILDATLVHSITITIPDVDPCEVEEREGFVLEVFENDIGLEVPVLDEDGEPVMDEDGEPEVRALGWDPDNWQDNDGASELSYDDGALRVDLNLEHTDADSRNVMYVFDAEDEGVLEGHASPLPNMQDATVTWHMTVPDSYEGANVQMLLFIQMNGGEDGETYGGAWQGQRDILSDDESQVESLGDNQYKYSHTFTATDDADPDWVQRIGLQFDVSGSTLFGVGGDDILIHSVEVSFPE